MRTRYESRNPNAGVINYEFTDDGIILEFRGGRFRYLYNATSPGPGDVATMKRLAAEGRGLTTFVSRHVRERYAARLPLQQPGS